MTASSYRTRLLALLSAALEAETPHVSAAAEVIARSFDADGLLYIFGSGHSHMFAEEAFYRAGGPARVCPILSPPHMLHEGAVRSTELERERGHATALLARYAPEPQRDCMLVVSNSGANALPVEMAEAAKDAGLPVIAITSRAYASSIERPGLRLHDIADVVLDNHCPPGDALVQLGPDMPQVGPASTVVGLALLNSVLVEVAAQQLRSSGAADVFLSANMPGASDHNAGVVQKLKARIPHL